MPLCIPLNICYCTAHSVSEALELSRSFHCFSPFTASLTTLEVLRSLSQKDRFQVRSSFNSSSPVSKAGSVFSNPSILMVKQCLRSSWANYSVAHKKRPISYRVEGEGKHLRLSTSTHLLWHLYVSMYVCMKALVHILVCLHAHTLIHTTK